ncbi:MAG: ABC transporter permease [Dehalococcoidia bacterium]
MLQYIARRAIHSAIVLFIVTLIGFFLTHVLPGDPAGQILGDNASPQAVSALREELNLDAPLYEQYADWLGNAVRLDFGRTFRSGLDVRSQLTSRLAPTLELGLLSLTISFFAALCLGTLAAARRGTWIDAVARGIGVVGIATPNFWLGMVLILLLSVKLKWLPAYGYVPIQDDLVGNLKRIAMPVFALSLAQMAVLVRLVRASMIEVLSQDYIRTARAKGLSMRRVHLVHGLRNAMIPVLTVAGLQIGRVIGGSAVIETIFAIPGVGRFTAESVGSHEYNVVQAVMLLAGVTIVAANLAVDLSYGWIDPRIRYRS